MIGKALDFCLTALIAAITAFGIIALDRSRNNGAIIVVDLVEIMRLKTESVIAAGGDPEVEFEKMLSALTPAIQKLSIETGKPVFIKQAVMAGETIDLTDNITSELRRAGLLQ
jgi:hypothetical protein